MSFNGARVHLRFQLALLVLLALTVLLYGKISVDLFTDWWTQPNLSQGLLIVPCAAYIAYVRRHHTFAIPATLAPRGLALIALACVLYVAGTAAAEFFLLRMSLMVLLTGCLWALWGDARMRSLVFPLVLAASAIPLPAIVYNTAAAPLQLLASDAGAGLAQSFGVTVYRDGNVINLAHMSLGIEEACSGLNSLSAMLAAAVLLGFMICRRNLSRSFLIVVSVPVAIGANIFRVAGTAVLADYNEQFAEGFYHALQGWLIFLVGFVSLFACARLTATLERRTTCCSGR